MTMGKVATVTTPLKTTLNSVHLYSLVSGLLLILERGPSLLPNNILFSQLTGLLKGI